MVESRHKSSGAVEFCHKTPRGGQISLQNIKWQSYLATNINGRLDHAANTKGQSNLAAKHQRVAGFHRKIQKPA